MLTFAKYQGAGNDFILIDDRTAQFPLDKAYIAHLCHRKFGIGADGLILLQNPLRMRIFNSDGREAESCGNGLRCLGRFLLDLGFPKKPHQIKTHDRTVEISYLEDNIAVAMGEAKDLKLDIPTEKGPLHFVNTGVPHAVQFVPEVESAPLEVLGPYFRHHLQANASLAALQPDGSIRVRTFERGVEGETLACGTGACAVAYIASHLHSLPGPIPIHYPGGTLHITLHGKALLMAGPATKVFDGSYA